MRSAGKCETRRGNELALEIRQRREFTLSNVCHFRIVYRVNFWGYTLKDELDVLEYEDTVMTLLCIG